MQQFWSIPTITRRAWKVWYRNLEVFFKTWKVNFFPPLIEALLYLFAIGLGIGSYVKEICGYPVRKFHRPCDPCYGGHELGILRVHLRILCQDVLPEEFRCDDCNPALDRGRHRRRTSLGGNPYHVYVIIMLPVLVAFGVISLPLSLLAIPLAFLGGLMFAGSRCASPQSPQASTP